MGLGDEIMASGVAKRLHRETGKIISICDVQGRPRWSDMWLWLDYIIRPEKFTADIDILKIKNGPGCRPYIDYSKGFTRKTGCKFTNWACRDSPGEIKFSYIEQSFARLISEMCRQYIVIEPNIGPDSSPNKQWPLENFIEVVRRMKNTQFIQFSFPSKNKKMILDFPNVDIVNISNFRLAAAVLSNARAYAGVEGGLHHAAGILGVPGVVIFGGFISPIHTGYNHHFNIADSDHTDCGAWEPCQGCNNAMRKIEPKDVTQALYKILTCKPYAKNFKEKHLK
jgi:ADP-heptose:LPS heptosyltransferase